MEPSEFDKRYAVRIDDVVEYYAVLDDAKYAALCLGSGTTLRDRVAHSGQPSMWIVGDSGLLTIIRRKITIGA